MIILFARATGGEAKWLPDRIRPELHSAIVEMSQRLHRWVAAGGTHGRIGNIETVEFPLDSRRYRLDLENLAGDNLKR